MPLTAQTLELLDELNKPANQMADAIVSSMFAAVRHNLRGFAITPAEKEPSAELTAVLYAYLKASTRAQLAQEADEAAETAIMGTIAQALEPRAVVLVDVIDEAGSLD
jgi:hypothetical protein